MDSVSVSKENARRFLVSRQGFHVGKGKDGTLETIRRLECVQIDPVNVIHRNHHLVLHTRVSDYEPSYLDALLYEDRAVFEYWCNEKSIIPIEDFRYFKYRMRNFMEFHSPFYERLKAGREQLKDAISHVLASIKAKGPLSAQEFKEDKKFGSKTAQRVLNLLWDIGKVMIHHMEKNRRCYDLTERVLPSSTNTETPSRAEYESFMIEKYMRAYGLIDVRDWRFGWLDLKASRRRVIIEEMVEDGRIHPVEIEGVRHIYYVLEKDLDALTSSEDSLDEKVHFVAPLDNLIWNRRMVSEVFDFDYSWEIYKPPEKRLYGYYVLPIVQGSRFVGRIDPKLDRRSQTMVINSLLVEVGQFSEALVYELAVALRSFLRFHSALKIQIVRTRPKALGAALLAELNLIA
jgi:uncharacterized protein YcaQ